MSLPELAAQPLIVSPGFSRSASESFKTGLAAIPVGGVIFLGYNIPGNADELMSYTRELQEASAAAGAFPLFISIDHEGGTVFRLRGIIDNLPNASETDLYSHEELHTLYLESMEKIRSLGFNMNFAPILEPLTEENQEFLRYRSYSHDPQEVYKRAGAMITAMQQTRVSAVGKHFPGSGDGDPHYVLPVISEPMNDPLQTELVAFSRAVRELELPAIMTAHVMVPDIDPELPATISATVIQDLLRKKIGFSGLIITDDLYMRGMTLRYAPEQTAVLALAAGADMLLAMGSRYDLIHQSIIEAVKSGELRRERLIEANARIIAEKIRLGLLYSDQS
ncbi:glycoside hydrolase family 3 N-terminal domain-containing protein [Spirochaeta dissipatitropha]